MQSIHKKKIENAFDKGAENYDWAALIQREVAQKLAEFLLNTPPENILEIGCGTGFLTRLLVQKYPEANIIAIDISQAMIEKCQKKLPFVSFEKEDGETYQPSQKFDLIISNMAVQWFDKPNEGLNRLKGFLNPDGTLLYSTLGENNFTEWQDVLKKLNLRSNTLPSRHYEDIIEEEEKNTMYQDAFDFVKSLKEIGANHSDQRPLTPSQLKKACALLKDKHYCSITWHVLYGCFKRPPA